MVHFLIDRPESLKVLDAACGTGLFTIGLARLGRQHSFRGLDLSEGMLQVAEGQRKKLGLSNVSFQKGNVEALPFAGGAFDVVVVGALLPNLNAPERALREFARVLKDGGKLVVIEFDRKSMNLWTRVFFRVMITGYRMVSFCFKRFRFADRWNEQDSTVNEENLRRMLEAEGLRLEGVDRLANHMILHCVR